MASVTGFTAERMQAIEDETIVSAAVVNGHLILSRHDGTTQDAGAVIGPQGIQGLTGPASIAVVTSTTRPTGASRFVGLEIYETDTTRKYIWDGTNWVPQGVGVFICTSSTRPANPFTGLHIFESDTGSRYVYVAGAWSYIGPKMPHTSIARVDNPAPNSNTSSLTYVDLPSGLGMANFQKYRADSSLIVRVEGVIAMSAALRVCTVGINIGGTVTPVFVLSALQAQSYGFSGTAQINGLAAGNIPLLKVQWMVNDNTLIATEMCSWILTVQEIMS